MRCMSMLVLTVANLIAASPVYALDVCSLVSRSEMATAIGEAISSAKLDGPDEDQASGSQAWTCTYGLAKGVLVVSVAEFASTNAARNFVTLENLQKELKDVQIQVTEESGIGDRAFLLTDEEGITLTVLKGARYYALTAGGHKFPPDRLKASLRKIANILLPRL